MRTPANATTATQAAEQVIAKLVERRSTIETDLRRLTSARSALAYKATAENDADARKRILEIAREADQKSGEIGDIDDAFAVARAKLAAAESAERAAVDREAAKALRVELQMFVRLGAEMDRHLAAWAAAANEAKACLDRIHALGQVAPNWQQFETFGQLALSSVTMFTPFKKEGRHLSPAERRLYRDLFTGWVLGAECNVRARLGEQPTIPPPDDGNQESADAHA
jgi:hypothetical protein